MKRFYDALWVLSLLLIFSVFYNTQTRIVFVLLTNSYPVAMGFIKVAVLSTLGEFLAKRDDKK